MLWDQQTGITWRKNCESVKRVKQVILSSFRTIDLFPGILNEWNEWQSRTLHETKKAFEAESLKRMETKISSHDG